MLIRNNRSQKIIFYLSLLALIGLTILTLLHNAFLTMLDNFSAELSFHMLASFPRITLKIIYFFNHGFGALLIIFLLCFFLWGEKYKLPAFWIFITSICGGLLLHILDFIIPAANLNQNVQFPSFGIFWATLIYSFIQIFIIPELTSAIKRFSVQLLLLIGWLGTFVASLFHQDILLSGVLAGWLFALVIIEFFEMQYVKRAPYFSRMHGFHNTWY